MKSLTNQGLQRNRGGDGDGERLIQGEQRSGGEGERREGMGVGGERKKWEEI